MQHEPCGLLSDLERPMNLPRRDAVLAVGNQPHSGQPFAERNRAVLKDRADFDGELAFGMTGLALPHAALCHIRHVRSSTSRARHSIRPSALYEVSDAIVEIAEIDDCGLECLGFHMLTISKVARIRPVPCLHKVGFQLLA